MEADKLGDVCPACGLPRKVFEPYREKVSANRKKILGFDLHPIAIHLSQTFVVLIPIMLILTRYFPDIYFDVFSNVLIFSIIIFPLTLILAIITGVIDGLTRFKSLTPPLLKVKIIVSGIILFLSLLNIYLYKQEQIIFLLIFSLLALACAVRLGLWGKKLIDVILPGTYPMKKGNKIKNESKEEKKVDINEISQN
ncbi:MAG: hypothetical protein A2033_11810 [Bacteroidetes bacterium GWA2_31_9]|nr:MAG: hypothetical protein A2033_11810 [Bacteroidetes bacterium GWA2_31_9]